MAKLRYDIEVTGASKVANTLSGVESRMKASADRMGRLRDSRGRFVGGDGAGGGGAGGGGGRQRKGERLSLSKVGIGGGGLSGVGAMGASMLAMGGVAGVGAIINEEKRLRGSIADLSYQLRGTAGAKGGLGDIQGAVSGVVKALAVESGRGAIEITDAWRALHESAGSMEAGQKLMPFVTTLADATGSQLEEVAKSAGLAFDAASRSGLSFEQSLSSVKSVMMDAAGMAKVGAVEFGNAVPVMGQLLSLTTSYAGKSEEVNRTMLGLLQVVTPVSSSVEDATTSIKRFTSNLFAKADNLKAMGIDVFKGGVKGQKVGDINTIIGEVLERTGGDIGAIGKIFGEEGVRTFQAFLPAFMAKGGKKAGRGDKLAGTGKAAVDEMLGKFSNAAMSEAEMVSNAADRRQQADRQFERAVEQLKQAVGEHLLPAVTKLVPEFVKLIPNIARAAEALSRLVSWFAENPFQGIGALVGAAITKDIAMAGIGNLLSGAFSSAASNGQALSKSLLGLNLAAGAAAVGVTAFLWQLGKLIDERREQQKDAKDERENAKGIAELQGYSTRELNSTEKGLFDGPMSELTWTGVDGQLKRRRVKGGADKWATAPIPADIEAEISAGRKYAQSQDLIAQIVQPAMSRALSLSGGMMGMMPGPAGYAMAAVSTAAGGRSPDDFGKTAAAKMDAAASKQIEAAAQMAAAAALMATNTGGTNRGAEPTGTGGGRRFGGLD